MNTKVPVSTVEEKELKPCPVCGGEMVLHDNDWADPPLWRQVCAGCGLSTGESATRALAIERGNRRATIPVERDDGEAERVAKALFVEQEGAGPIEWNSLDETYEAAAARTHANGSGLLGMYKDEFRALARAAIAAIQSRRATIPVKRGEEFEKARKRMGGWTLDDIAESVLSDDDIGVSLTEAILAVVDMCRALLRSPAREQPK